MYVTGRATETVCTFWSTEKFLAPVGFRALNRPARNLVTIPVTPLRIFNAESQVTCQTYCRRCGCSTICLVLPTDRQLLAGILARTEDWGMFSFISHTLTVNRIFFLNYVLISLLGAFAKLRKATISFSMPLSVRLSVCPSVRMERHGSRWMDFHGTWYSSSSWKSFEKIQASLKSDAITVNLHEDRYTFVIKSRSVLLRMRNVSDKSCRESQKHFIFNKFFFPRKSYQFLDYVENYCTAGQATDENAAHAHCMLDT